MTDAGPAHQIIEKRLRVGRTELGVELRCASEQLLTVIRKDRPARRRTRDHSSIIADAPQINDHNNQIHLDI
ncbi:hypothetical protein [Nocardia otitidiscaviarum]|uniref:hypothetical protein n=1 Tax=Nocardia otitidiscaviarum TaxID=1823 RepID=UPI0012F84F56|nr:hypothetical protein [Nocardia otitidiscaviarum]